MQDLQAVDVLQSLSNVPRHALPGAEPPIASELAIVLLRRLHITAQVDVEHLRNRDRKPRRGKKIKQADNVRMLCGLQDERLTRLRGNFDANLGWRSILTGALPARGKASRGKASRGKAARGNASRGNASTNNASRSSA